MQREAASGSGVDNGGDGAEVEAVTARNSATVKLTRLNFLTWQCRLRKRSMREDGGKPSPGMCPTVILPDGTEMGPIVVLLMKHTAASESAELRFMVARTQDPAERYRRGLRFLQAEYYLRPAEFNGDLTAVFGQASQTASRLIEEGQCRLEFAEARQEFGLSCDVRELDPDEDAWQASYWHNRLFNPGLSPDCRIVTFSPGWAGSLDG